MTPARCRGLCRGFLTLDLARCDNDALWGEYCYFHAKVVDGLIVNLDGRRRLSWQPSYSPNTIPRRDEDQLRDALRLEWDLDVS